MTSWDASARSIDPLTGDGWFSVSIPAASTGVAVGFARDQPLVGYAHIEHGFLVVRGQYRIIERGREWPLSRAVVAGERCYVLRIGGVVSYYLGDSLSSAMAEGAVRVSDTLSSGEVFVASSLLSFADELHDLQIGHGRPTAGMLTLPRMAMQGYSGAVASGSLWLPHPTISADTRELGVIRLSPPAPSMMGYAGNASGMLTLPAPSMLGYQWQITEAWLRPPRPAMSGYGGPYIAPEITLYPPAPGMTAYNGRTGGLLLPRPFCMGIGDGRPVGAYFNGTLPRLSGAATAEFSYTVSVLPSFGALVDWAALIQPDSTDGYVARLEPPGGEGVPLNLRISSWQSTIQIGRANYLQAVVPAAVGIMPLVQSRSDWDLVVYRQAVIGDDVFEAEMARVPLGTIAYNAGPRNATLTLSGYARTETYPDYGMRPLRGVQTLSAGGSMRVRAEIDWWLRPGMVAQLPDGSTMTVRYINYYVSTSGPLAAMDVGDSASG